jgi:hypothetical protein
MQMSKRSLLTSVLALFCITTIIGCNRPVSTAAVASPTPARSTSSQAVNQAVNEANPGVAIEDTAKYEQILAISDVHGTLDTATNLLQKAQLIDANSNWTAARTLLIVTGDSIDSGPKSLEVLRLWMKLQPEADNKGSRVLVLLGNHEAEFLAAANPAAINKFSELITSLNSNHVSVKDLQSISTPEGKFLRNMPVAAKVGTWIFCHAGWVPDMPWQPFVDAAKDKLQNGKYSDPLIAGDESILELKEKPVGTRWWKSGDSVKELKRRLAAMNLNGVVFGHQPSAFVDADEGIVAAIDDRHIIKIDSGIPPKSGSHPGQMLLFTTPGELDKPAAPHVQYIDAKGNKGDVKLEAGPQQ